MSIHTTQEAMDAISNILHEAGAGGVVIEDPYDLEKEYDTPYGELYALNPDDYPTDGIIIKAYLPVSHSLVEKIKEIKQTITELASYMDIGRNVITTNEVDDEDWATAWKKYYHPIKISDKFTIVPSWETYERGEEELIIELDPGMAFGTGTHPTTIMCIQALEKTVKSQDTVLDVGTGSGILSIAAAMLEAKEVYAYDLDPVAVESATENVNLNKVSAIVQVQENNLLEGIETNADVIVANILADIIMLFTLDAYKLLKTDGFFITSGIIESKKMDVEIALIEAGFTIAEVITMDDWVAFIAKK